jgi:hypothetical protein
LRKTAILLGVLPLVAGVCGDNDVARASPNAAASCPKAWSAGWQKLANRVQTAVFCPSWMPPPLDGQIGGAWFNGEFVSQNRAYLVSFVWQETGAAGTEVHVNFRGYPGQTRIPTCEDTVTAGKKILHPKLPCFADARGTRRARGITATVYTANQGADQWHVLYAWRRGGSLYTISEHVAPPLTYPKVVANLDRLLKSLVLVRPEPA